MAQGIGLFFITVFSAVALIALFITLATLFPRQVERTRRAADTNPGRSFVVGLVNLLFFGAVATGFAAINESVGGNVFMVPALIILALLTIAMTLGLAAMAWLTGQRLHPKPEVWRQVMWGGLVLTLGSLTPFLGWFGLFPYLGITGLGAFILGWFRRKTPPEIEESQGTHHP